MSDCATQRQWIFMSDGMEILHVLKDGCGNALDDGNQEC